MHEFIDSARQRSADRKPSLDIRIRDVCAAAAEVGTVEAFRSWIREEVRHVLPHGALVCGHGRLTPGGMATECVLAVDYPVEYLIETGLRDGETDSPLLHRWFLTGAPVLFDAASPWGDMSENWLSRFRRQGLVNAALHAGRDEALRTCTYFSFHRLPPPLGQLERAILIGMTPLLHETLLRVIAGIVPGGTMGGISLPEGVPRIL